MKLTILSSEYSVCRLEPDKDIPAWIYDSPFFNITKTPEELSIVVESAAIPENIQPTQSEAGWSCIQIIGPLDFSLTGILANLTVPLAQHGISIFAISTYDTDYILVKKSKVKAAQKILSEIGHTFC